MEISDGVVEWGFWSFVDSKQATGMETPLPALRRGGNRGGGFTLGFLKAPAPSHPIGPSDHHCI